MTTKPMPAGIAFVNGSSIELSESVSYSRSGNRLTNIVQYADPVWIISLISAPLRFDERRRLQAWFTSLRGGLNGVLFRHPNYSKPLLSTSAAAADSGVLAAIVNGDTLTVNSVAAGLVLTQGDWLSLLATNGVRGLVQVDEVSGSGTTRTIKSTLPIDAEFVGATVYFDRVEILTRPVVDSWTPQSQGSLASVTFQLSESRT